MNQLNTITRAGQTMIEQPPPESAVAQLSAGGPEHKPDDLHNASLSKTQPSVIATCNVVTNNVVPLPQAVATSVILDVPVFPCMDLTHPTVKENILKWKSPHTKNGFKDASFDHVQINSWWKKWPDALIGMPTGEVSGYVILDVDDKHGRCGADSLYALETANSKLPDTWQVLTPSGGFHYWFKYPGTKVDTSGSRIGDGLDIRGDGGYVVIPPSAGYVWEASNPDEAAEMPQWLVELCNQKPEKKKKKAKQTAKSEIIARIKRKGTSFYPSLPPVNQLHNFPVGKYAAEFIGWTVLEPNAFKLKTGQARIEMRFCVFARTRQFYISSFHTVDVLQLPSMYGQISTGRSSQLAIGLNNVIGGLADDGYPIQLDLTDVDLESFAGNQLMATVKLTKKKYAIVETVSRESLTNSVASHFTTNHLTSCS